MDNLPVILDLCAGTGSWSRPYLESGKYNVIELTLPLDIRLVEHLGFNRVHGILAAPPCTVFALSGNRWVRTKAEMLDALSVVDACLRFVVLYRPRFWALENPVGKLVRYLGRPTHYFDPCDYGDPYTKRTALWGRFNVPDLTPVRPVKKSPIHHMAPGPERAKLRSITPKGFAEAFFRANP